MEKALQVLRARFEHTQLTYRITLSCDSWVDTTFENVGPPSVGDRWQCRYCDKDTVIVAKELTAALFFNEVPITPRR